jgi:hypothetical protein
MKTDCVLYNTTTQGILYFFATFAHYSHSRQFRSNIIYEWDYWKYINQEINK